MLLLVTIGFCSCATKTYTVSELRSNYALKMTSKKNQVLFDKIEVFMSENEIDKLFEVKSINAYQPLIFPIFGSFSKSAKKNLLKTAVKQASSKNCDAVLIINESHYKLIKYQ